MNPKTFPLLLAALLVTGDLSAQQPPPSGAPPAASAPAGTSPAGQPPPGYGPPPAGYGQPPPGYPPPGYGYPPPGYGYPPPPAGYYAPPPGYYYAPAGPPPEEKRRYSTGLMVGGIVTTAVGAVMFGAGGVLFADADSRINQVDDCACPAGGPCNCGGLSSSNDSQKTAAIAVMIIGGVLTLGGIPMIIVGARKVSDKPDDETKAAFVPRLHIGMRRAALDWRF